MPATYDEQQAAKDYRSWVQNLPELYGQVAGIPRKNKELDMTKTPQKTTMEEVSDKYEVSDKAKPAKTPNSKGYWQVQYLKQAETMGTWATADMLFPTEEEAHAYADTLREGRHAAISVTHKDWE